MAQQELLRILECPACIEFMFAPIYICSAGHSICHKCKVKVRHCPTCRASFNPTKRNYSLEHVSAIISFPCPYERDGCAELTKYENLKDHTKYCCFRPYDCIVVDCDFKGPRDALKKHVEKQHAQISWMRELNHVAWVQTKPTYETQVALCYDEMFYIRRFLVNNRNDSRNGNIYWACQFLGKGADAANFTYTITIDDNDKRILSFSDRCQSDLLTMEDMIDSGHSFALPINVFKSFMNSKNQIIYHVTIESKSDREP